MRQEYEKQAKGPWAVYVCTNPKCLKDKKGNRTFEIASGTEKRGAPLTITCTQCRGLMEKVN